MTLWRRIRPHVTSWTGLAPFLAFALFPFYWAVITSFKTDANLYDLYRQPFWFAKTDGLSGEPYHKDIIIPASFREGPVRWRISAGAHTTRFDSEQSPKPIATIADQMVYSPVDGTLKRIDIPTDQIAHPNDVIGTIQVVPDSWLCDSFLSLCTTLTHYKFLASTPFYGWMRNSLVAGAAVVLITVLISVPAAYALARLRFRGNRTLGIGIFLTYLIPATILFIPFSQFVGSMHIADTIWSLILSYPTFTIPFCTWLLMGFFRSVPKEIEERALLDGATRLQMLRLVVIPVVLPGILTAAIFAFTLSFQEYVYALTFISSTVNRTLPVGISVEMVRGDVYFWGPLMASAIVGSIPVVIVYALSLDWFISGMTTGAVK